MRLFEWNYYADEHSPLIFIPEALYRDSRLNPLSQWFLEQNERAIVEKREWGEYRDGTGRKIFEYQ